jgi:hypothetical protein
MREEPPAHARTRKSFPHTLRKPNYGLFVDDDDDDDFID